MKNIIKTIVCFLVLVILSSSCRKKAFDDFYGAPANLAQPIYQVLQAKGNFKSLLACIDKAGYKDILSTAGYWTMFAADDSAFKVFLTGRGITDIAQLDSGTAKQIVTYALVYNAFMKARLGDYQSSKGWVANSAYKRRTAYYTGYYNDSTQTPPVVALSANRNGAYVFGDNNNKYIPYFVDNFLTGQGLTSSDYTYFYPTTAYTGFNVADASVVNADIVAQNGYIHEINKVVLPLPNVDQYLAANSQYSEFKKLFDKYMVAFIQSADASTRYQTLTGLTKNVYIKLFTSALAYSPNNENYLKLQDNDAQSDGFTMLAPTNATLLSYINSVLLEHYSSLDAMPPQIIVDFLNAHMWQRSDWPSKFGVFTNFQGELATINPANDVVDKKILSNGLFYGTTQVQQANVFRTVYGKAYLDPAYLLMTKALDMSGIRYSITVPSLKYTVFMMSDSSLRANGYDWNVAQSAWQYTTPHTATVTVGNAARDQLYRILNTHVVATQNNELNSLSGSGIIETFNGEYIKYNAGTVYSAGCLDSNYVVHTSSSKTAYNGLVYYDDNLLIPSAMTLGFRIKQLGSLTTSSYNYFYQLLSNSPLYNTTTGDIQGITPGVFYTIFIPSNAAITQAVKDGILPGTVATGVPNFAPTVLTDKVLVANFIYYHILNKTTVVPDGKKTGTFTALLQKNTGDPTVFNISSSPNQLSITDNYSRVANVIVASSNNLANRCVIHLIDNYLKYNLN
jgi:uncharacterized surface protein with fasciclin (FAS1) repeats